MYFAKSKRGGDILRDAFDPLPIVVARANSDLAALQIQLGEHTVTPENTMSVDGQHALQDMVEFEMYLVSKSQQAPWPMLPRRCKKMTPDNKLHSKSVDPSTVAELIRGGFIEATSSQTFVVSKSGYQFYKTEMKPHSSLTQKDGK